MLLIVSWNGQFSTDVILPSEIDKINMIKELLCIMHKLFSLSLLDSADIDYIVESLCTQ